MMYFINESKSDSVSWMTSHFLNLHNNNTLYFGILLFINFVKLVEEAVLLT